MDEVAILPEKYLKKCSDVVFKGSIVFRKLASRQISNKLWHS
jgi:hypothetical protein